ncbi:MAG: cyclic pyranopterin phosphate synthase [Patiriisocius sp.]|jgi:cyclic pyranopterin phosphate synthase
MVDITHKKTSLRIAKASAILYCQPDTIQAVIDKNVPKGDVLEMAKTAGLFAVKKTSDMIPDCHPIPVEGTEIIYEIKETEIHIFITVKAIYRTGMEVEAMHGASVIALTMYDMLKPIDKNIEIRNIKLLHKSGGKSDLNKVLPKNVSVAFLANEKMDISSEKFQKWMSSLKQNTQKYNLRYADIEQTYHDKNSLISSLENMVKEELEIIFILGGTGLSETDNTPEIIKPIFDKELPAVSTQLINYGLERTFRALVSRPTAGTINKSIVLCLPGSFNGVKESIAAILPEVIYLVKSLNFRS